MFTCTPVIHYYWQHYSITVVNSKQTHSEWSAFSLWHQDLYAAPSVRASLGGFTTVCDTHPLVLFVISSVRRRGNGRQGRGRDRWSEEGKKKPAFLVRKGNHHLGKKKQKKNMKDLKADSNLQFEWLNERGRLCPYKKHRGMQTGMLME